MIAAEAPPFAGLPCDALFRRNGGKLSDPAKFKHFKRRLPFYLAM
jgi:hypothetical protein